MPRAAERVPEVVQRRVWRIRGSVQGVGFRPHVYRLATAAGVRGAVWNDPDGVVVDVEGSPAVLDALLARVLRDPPPAAHVERVETRTEPLVGHRSFEIRASLRSAPTGPRISPDLATCAACLSEMDDAADRRAGYPFLNCTDCGPRFTIVREVPYDRAATTMAAFRMCDACAAEYHDPCSRRFHAQPTACRDCGPQLWAEEPDRRRVAGGADAVALAADALRRGRVVAVKGLGGFHLACRARDDAAVRRLRERKHRGDKPLAVMFPSLGALERAVEVDARSREELTGPRRAIVLLPRRRGGTGWIAAAVAPGLRELGVFLPYTPLHHQLLRAVGEPLVMTSGNRSEEPIVARNEEARERLAAIADLLLLHDREIESRCDDSVMRPLQGALRVLRRARGHVPEALALPFAAEAPDIWAVGADLKNAPALGQAGAVVLAPHVGDLETWEARAFHAEIADRLPRLFRARPDVVAHDLHPGYHGTALARASGLRRIAVQHHHAHIASCLADNGRAERVIGVAWDGTGYGPDGTVWGGEILAADLGGYERVGRLRPVPMPGGDVAARQGWRMALAHLHAAGLAIPSAGGPRRAIVARMVAAGVNAPLTSSAGRLFDAASSVLGLRHENTYEGQAAMELEAVADGDEAPYELAVARADGLVELDPRPLWIALAADVERGTPARIAAARVHAGLADAIARACVAVRATTGLSVVALSGGCFQNARLTRLARRELAAAGFEVLLHERVPPNDGGIALGQAAVAAWQLGREG